MSEFLSEEDGAKIRKLLRTYHRTKLEAVKSRESKELAAAVTLSSQIHDEIWSITIGTGANPPAPFVRAVQRMVETHSKLVSKSLTIRLPRPIWWTLGTLLLVSSFMLGFTSALHGRRSRLTTGILLLSFSAVTVMIVDLDRPFRTLFIDTRDQGANTLLERKANRKTLDAAMRYTHEQGLAKRRLAVEEVFHPSTMGLVEAEG